MPELIYFSSTSENTHRFIERLALPARRIPLHDKDGLFIAEQPYVLVVPTYGGGTHVLGRADAAADRGHVPKQVVRFLNNKHNRDLLRGVIAAGNTNFGDSYCFAGDIIARKCGVPYLYRFELMGTAEDVVRVREGLEQFWSPQQPPRTPVRS